MTNDEQLDAAIRAAVSSPNCQKCGQQMHLEGKRDSDSAQLLFTCPEGHIRDTHWKNVTKVRNRTTDLARLEKRYAQADDPTCVMDQAEEVMQEQRIYTHLRGA